MRYAKAYFVVVQWHSYIFKCDLSVLTILSTFFLQIYQKWSNLQILPFIVLVILSNHKKPKIQCTQESYYLDAGVKRK